LQGKWIIKMKRLTFIFIATLLSGVLLAQTSREEIKNNVYLSGSNYLAYPAPMKALTPAPKGKKPFYISHYGRHGSRYLIDRNEYYGTIDILRKADEAGKLTDEGKDLLEKVIMMAEESNHRLGELTELGAIQHRQIAHRMYDRFPEVFKGDVHIDAKSTVVIRCILSMENELQELITLNPKLIISHDASEHDMYYMNFSDKKLTDQRTNDACNNFFNNWKQENIHPEKFIRRVFNDDAYVNDNINKVDFYSRIFDLAGIVQNSFINLEISLYDLFDEDDIYTLWQSRNISWFLHYGPNELNGGKQPFTQRNLLRKMISEADSCIAFPRPGATLRFGHETMVLPLTCLLNLNGYGEVMHPRDLEKNHWYNYKIFPMGCNIQFIFYRSSPKDEDVLVKVLLNEEEATLPIKAVEGPYYSWKEVREYYLNKINSFEY